MKLNIKENILARVWVLVVVLFILAAFAVAGAQTATVTTQLNPGDSGQQVSALQTFLAADPSVYPEGLVTGYYGNLTVAAVGRYQCKNGIVCSGDPTSTGYGRVGLSTLAKIQLREGIGAGSTSAPPVGYSSSGDVYAPVLTTPTAVVTQNSAAIHWTTNEPAHSRVMYGLFWPFTYADAPSVVDTSFDTSSDTTITGLRPNTVYYYVLESTDSSGNLQWGINHSFKTSPY